VASCGTCIFRDVTSISRHPSFANNPTAGYPNDVSVITFAAIMTNVNIAYATIAAPADGTYEGQSCTVVGWGRTTPAGNLPNILQMGQLNVISISNCASAWGAARIYPGQMCTNSGSVAPCTGDNGSPLICNGKVAGAFSWGDAQCDPTNPSVHTRISYFRTWIEQQP